MSWSASSGLSPFFIVVNITVVVVIDIGESERGIDDFGAIAFCVGVSGSSLGEDRSVVDASDGDGGGEGRGVGIAIIDDP